ncbi:MAG: hypothetical protein A3J48_03740 [Candidatus Doudnabacteria bacterium RIFCSPHIGHO2_02_FULL_46_11]|uniref:Arginase n=1 Tax=Candidatus Doudnabacteria bacterium RIFCSPHIGHO2_02_FULL_46_11 TaxID=1817832 RepID=A0A1F5P4D2_9BACT|nr:MAG: hypothetical protein A3J48_03740 [Candidatus Doudnabacteria bacterium RIFCSPHIGHO2_02_FULL_46_11]
MKKIHFYKSGSRLGLKNPPWGSAELNIGVEDGPDAILTAEFLSAFPEAAIDEFTFLKPEGIDDSSYFKILADSYGKFEGKINDTIEAGETQVAIGGDHSITFATISALLDRIQSPEQLGYIQIDSHPDMLLYSQSSTKNFHGMYLRALLSDFDIPEINNLAPKKLMPQNMWFIGNLDFDGPERDFFESHKIRHTSVQQLCNGRAMFVAQLENFVRRYEYIHLSFDVDGLDRSLVSATGIPAKDGLLEEHFMPVIEAVKNHPGLSFELVELNPRKQGASASIKVCQSILSRLLI